MKGKRQAARKEREKALEICMVGWRENSGAADSTGPVNSQKLVISRCMYVDCDQEINVCGEYLFMRWLYIS